jgi:very-short-patch-repair endonuclease
MKGNFAAGHSKIVGFATRHSKIVLLADGLCEHHYIISTQVKKDKVCRKSILPLVHVFSVLKVWP